MRKGMKVVSLGVYRIFPFSTKKSSNYKYENILTACEPTQQIEDKHTAIQQSDLPPMLFPSYTFLCQDIVLKNALHWVGFPRHN